LITPSGDRKSGAWWWDEEVREKVKEKQNAYAALSSCTLVEEKGVREATYKVAKKLAKKAVAIAKNKAYERIYQRLETKERMYFDWRGLGKGRQGT